MSDETEDDLDARIIARAAHLLTPPPPTPAQRIAALEAELARERVRFEAAEAEVSRLGSTAFEHRMRAYGAESRVRELEARFGAIWTVERTDRVRALRQSHPDTVGRQSDDEILGAALDDFLSSAGSEARERRPAVGEDPPDPAKTSPI